MGVDRACVQAREIHIVLRFCSGGSDEMLCRFLLHHTHRGDIAKMGLYRRLYFLLTLSSAFPWRLRSALHSAERKNRQGATVERLTADARSLASNGA
jgi:hypothetical protein